MLGRCFVGGVGLHPYITQLCFSLSSHLGLSGVNYKSLIDLFMDNHLFCQALNQMVKTQEWKNLSLPLR